VKKVEQRLADEVKIRSAVPPEQFDDKGSIKKYTREELKELKGPDPRVPGYKADRDSIEKGRTVMVQVARRVLVPAGKGKGKERDLDAELEKEAALTRDTPSEKDDKPLVSLILVGPEPPVK
jgi:hypothetical protein